MNNTRRAFWFAKSPKYFVVKNDDRLNWSDFLAWASHQHERRRRENKDFFHFFLSHSPFVFIKLGKYLTFEVTDGMNEMEKKLLFCARICFFLHLSSINFNRSQPSQLSYFFSFASHLLYVSSSFCLKKSYFDSFVMLSPLCWYRGCS